MSHVTIVNRSQLFAAAASAIGAVGLLIVSSPVQAHPMLPSAPAACDQYRFNGNFSLKQATGDTVVFSSIGRVPSGNATATGGRSELHGEVISGAIEHIDNKFDVVSFRIRWSADSIGHYRGDVSADGFAHGETYDELQAPFDIFGHVIDAKEVLWDSTVPLVCDTPASPPPPTASPAPPQNPLLLEPATELPNRREVPAFAPSTTQTPTP
jgi:hypothetical protein